MTPFGVFIYMSPKALFISTEKFENDSSEDAGDTFCELKKFGELVEK